MAILEKPMLSVLMTGLTHYLHLGTGANAVVYYETDRVAHMRLPNNDKVWKGEWSLQPEGWFVKWHGGPESSWQIRYAAPGTFEYLDAKKERRGVISRIVPGDAENIAS